MDSRRDFLKKATLLTGGYSLNSLLPNSIQKAMAIAASPGTTFYDAEHVVFLMQENRSFDHMFGSLKGVRGFNDPYPYRLPNQNKVWLQTDKDGRTFPPFHLDLNQTKITWQGGLPHSWPDQTAARNKGKYDRWIPVKSLLSMGHYQRQDLPFYYALADAFTVCDHSFCSSITGTTPNRLFFFTGANTPNPKGGSEQVVLNGQAESRDGVFVDWQTLPEVLEDHGIDWRVYQNELWTSALPEHQDDWVGNYGDNPLEYVKRYQVRLSAYFRKNGDPLNNLSPQEVTAKYEALPQRERNLIDKAFTTNIANPSYLDLAPFSYDDEKGVSQTIELPKSDIFYQFRKDVDEGKLPTVSWLVAPQRFSDHTSSPLYGTWYVSEAMDILTKNPEVWKKTIFILTYDENDGYFDHIPPYVVPKPGDMASGKCSSGVETKAEYHAKDDAPIGLGYRIPMVIASPWSKGGFVNSEVFDHTSSVQFLEKFLSKKTGKSIFNPQVTSWRRTVCGDLTSAFRPYLGEEIHSPKTLLRNDVVKHIQHVKDKPLQKTPLPLSVEAIKSANELPNWNSKNDRVLPQQERGTKRACALPHHFNVNLVKDFSKKSLVINFEVDQKSKGIPFLLTSLAVYASQNGKNWNFTVKTGDQLSYELPFADFNDGNFDLVVHGPNGFHRRFTGGLDEDFSVNSSMGSTGKIQLSFQNETDKNLDLECSDQASGGRVANILIKPRSSKTISVDLEKSHHWYHLQINPKGSISSLYVLGGHIETGKSSFTDPLMGVQT